MKKYKDAIIVLIIFIVIIGIATGTAISLYKDARNQGESIFISILGAMLLWLIFFVGLWFMASFFMVDLGNDKGGEEEVERLKKEVKKLKEENRSLHAKLESIRKSKGIRASLKWG